MNTIIYIRTSTDEQNPENQLKDCKSIYKSEYGEYEVIEDKESAWNQEKYREGFEKIKNLIKNRKLDNLIVWDLDRLYRNRKNLVDFFKYCEINKCKIFSYRQKWLIDINNIPSPWNEMMSDLMIQVMGWIAQDESDKKSERIKNAIRLKDDGAYSYKGNKWGRKTIIKKVKDEIIVLFNKGLSFRQICKEVTYWDKNNNKKNVSLGIVHKIIKEYKNGS
jgi:DNA invertase Pin-like site-specific DNA recombinase